MFSPGFFEVLGLFPLAGSPSGGLLCRAQFKPSKRGGTVPFLLINYFSDNKEKNLNDKENYVFMPVPRRCLRAEEWVNKQGGSHRESQTSKYTRRLPARSAFGHRNPGERGLEIPAVAWRRVVPSADEGFMQPPARFSWRVQLLKVAPSLLARGEVVCRSVCRCLRHGVCRGHQVGREGRSAGG